MILVRTLYFSRPAPVRAMRTALVLAVLGMAGCTQMGTVRHKPEAKHNEHPAAPVAAPAPPADGSAQDAGQLLPLSTIIGTYLLHGRYAEGEQHLRDYLTKYPGDRAALSLLRQLTTDPEVALGPRPREYVVQPGDSYSTLAARNLGDSSLFLILARYNGSANPSVLHVGETVRLPAAGARVTLAPAPAKSSARAVAAASTAADAAPPGETPAAKAIRLQDESTALFKQGRKDQALARLDQALTLDPHLRPAGNEAAREQLLASYHERAVVLYRDQKLDQAIALWDRVLTIDPNYERATIYRARAIELQHRLKQI
jgi:tetratricopeptide (TPR) repeat protein